MIRYGSYLTFMCCVNIWGKIQVYCGNSGWPADDNIQQLSHICVVSTCEGRSSVLWQSGWPADDEIQQLSHIYVLCQHVREERSVLWQQRVTRRWSDTAAISNLCVVSTCEVRYKFIVVTAEDPPMKTYNSYLTFMCCVNMWGKIQVYCGNSGWPADDNIQQLSHIYVLCQHVREATSLLW